MNGRIGSLWAFLGPLVILAGTVCEVRAEEKPNPFDRGQQLPPELGNVLDANGDGVVTDAETRQAAEALEREARAAKTERSKAIMEAFDKNQDGVVDGGEAADAAAHARIASDRIGRVVAEIFSKLDMDGNGFVTQLEFATVVKNLGILGELLKPRLVQTFMQIDGNRDGAISVAESQMAADYFAQQAQMRKEVDKARQKQKLGQMAQQVFARLDGNRNGKISAREARRDPQVLQAFGEVDTNQDGQLTLPEVYSYMQRKSGG